MGLKEIGLEGVNWIDLAEGRNRWRAIVNTGMNLHESGGGGGGVVV
jgi:hypothetical protein